MQECVHSQWLIFRWRWKHWKRSRHNIML